MNSGTLQASLLQFSPRSTSYMGPSDDLLRLPLKSQDVSSSFVGTGNTKVSFPTVTDGWGRRSSSDADGRTGAVPTYTMTVPEEPCFSTVTGTEPVSQSSLFYYTPPPDPFRSPSAPPSQWRPVYPDTQVGKSGCRFVKFSGMTHGRCHTTLRPRLS